MKKLFTLTLALMASAVSASSPNFSKGVNVSHYLSQLGDRTYADSAQFNDKDMQWLAKKGYDHIRLPVDGPYLIDKDGSIRENRLKAIDTTLKWAKRHKLNVILDIHKLPGTAFSGDIDASLFEDPVLQEKSIRLWKLLAERFKDHGRELRFEILNEPVAEDPLLVNAFYEKVIKVIRRISPDRTIMVCSNRWGRFDTVHHLEPLLEYGNIVVAIHFYEPHLFTHQKARWVGMEHPDFPDIPFPGRVPELKKYVSKDHYSLDRVGDILTNEEVEKDFKMIAKWAKKNNATLHLGEFGVYNQAKPEYRENWYSLVLALCDKYDIDWAVWDYRGSFGVRDRETNKPTVVQKVIDPYLE